MLVSWNWLHDYVQPEIELEQIVDHLTMSGLNHESTTLEGSDFCIDLEVTSNRPDCLGHLGVAREIAVLTGALLKKPDVDLTSDGQTAVQKLCQVTIEAPELCRRYTARVVRGVKVGPSPEWLVQRLQTIGIESVNNVVDISNYVMLECGQPLHTFDLANVHGQQIIVREPRPDEQILAINHQTYSLQAGMCVIADAHGPVAIGGVMGGAESEISSETKDVLIEAAWFAPGSVRATARKLNLHSNSSFRFERSVDFDGIPWASARCAQLLVEIAGGEIVPGLIDICQPQPPREAIRFRYAQIARNLGIEIPVPFVKSTLQGLGVTIQTEDFESLTCLPPSWRRDLSREIDLVEEVGRIYGYDKVPDTITVPLTSSHKPQQTRVLEKVRDVVRAAGFDEAMCPSLLPEVWSQACSPWTDSEPLVSHQPMLGVLERGSQNVGAVNCLRRTLISSLLEAKRINEYRFNPEIDLFEIAHVYLPTGGELPQEPLMLGLVSGRDYAEIKGVVEQVCREIDPATTLEFTDSELQILEPSRSATVRIAGKVVGHVGVVSPGGKKTFGLRQPTTVAEIDLTALIDQAVLIRRFKPLSEFPAVSRDFNFILSDDVPWRDLEQTVRENAGPLLESITYRETFRDEQRDGAGKKRVLLSLSLRSHEDTLSGPQVDAVCQAVVAACQKALGAQLVS